MTAGVLKKCPKCGELSLKRLIGPGAAVLFKGSGFYTTESRAASYQKQAKADSEKTEIKDEKSKSKTTKEKSKAKNQDATRSVLRK